MLKLQALDNDQRARARKTMSSNAFYILVGDAMARRSGLSVVRMGDGEKLLLDECANYTLDSEPITPPKIKTPEEGIAWLKKLGVDGIPKNLLKARLSWAAQYANYFAPSISGLQHQLYDLHNFQELKRAEELYVDNFFVNEWTEDMKLRLFEMAGTVLLICRNAEPADAMQIRARKISVNVKWLKLDNWQESENVMRAAHEIEANLVLVCGGPASKFIIPEIAQGPKYLRTVLDIGNSLDQWLLSSLSKPDDHF